jgi:hypothetical protein
MTRTSVAGTSWWEAFIRIPSDGLEDQFP